MHLEMRLQAFPSVAFASSRGNWGLVQCGRLGESWGFRHSSLAAASAASPREPPATPDVIIRAGVAQNRDFQTSPLDTFIDVEPQQIKPKMRLLPSLNRQNKARSSFPSWRGPKDNLGIWGQLSVRTDVKL